MSSKTMLRKCVAVASAGLIAAGMLGVLAAAGAVCQLVIPGGLGRLFRRDGRSK